MVSRYYQNAKKQSQIFKDRPLSPLESAVYWTEYVIRHKGAPHLKSAAVELYWYQYLLIDVILFILIIGFLFLYVTQKIVKYVYKKYIHSKIKINKIKKS